VDKKCIHNFGGNSLEEKLLGSSRKSLEDNIKGDVEKTGCKDGRRIS
jgi:hypothetical protein